MGGMKITDLTTEYSKLGVDLGANVFHALSFKKGSSELSMEDMRRLNLIISEEVSDGDITLIIGYASKTCEPLDSEKLSSDHATTAAKYVAKYVALRLPVGQQMQAVFLGQTNILAASCPSATRSAKSVHSVEVKYRPPSGLPIG